MAYQEDVLLSVCTQDQQLQFHFPFQGQALLFMVKFICFIQVDYEGYLVEDQNIFNGIMRSRN